MNKKSVMPTTLTFVSEQVSYYIIMINLLFICQTFYVSFDIDPPGNKEPHFLQFFLSLKEGISYLIFPKLFMITLLTILLLIISYFMLTDICCNWLTVIHRIFLVSLVRIEFTLNG